MTPESPVQSGPGSRRRWRRRLRVAVLLAGLGLAWPLRPESTTSVVLPALSPFLTLGGVVAAGSLTGVALLALPLLVLTALVPRAFCHYGCPTGLLQEAVEQVRSRPARAAWRPPALGPWLVALTLGGMCLGYPFFLWLDPLALFNGFVNAWRQPLAVASLLTGFGLVLLLLFDLILPRVWCRRLCPLGATQDLLAWPRRRWRRPARCDAPDPQPAVNRRGKGMARRLFLGGCAGATGAWVLRPALARGQPPLRPPGALPEDRFQGVCVRCGNCAQACPSRIIRPEWSSGSLTGWLTPRLEFDTDYCREDCHRCGRVCPSGAIERLSLAEKRRRVIGPAAVDLQTCLLANGRECTACIQRCPFQAVALHSTDGGFSNEPRVDLARCTGCGACEAACPVRPQRAIRVAAHPGSLPLP